MKVIKRDGKIVDYDRAKIKIAIEKANKEVEPKERATEKQIENITKHIEDLKKKRMLVEDIQSVRQTGNGVFRIPFKARKYRPVYARKEQSIRLRKITDRKERES